MARDFIMDKFVWKHGGSGRANGILIRCEVEALLVGILFSSSFRVLFGLCIEFEFNVFMLILWGSLSSYKIKYDWFVFA